MDTISLFQETFLSLCEREYSSQDSTRLHRFASKLHLIEILFSSEWKSPLLTWGDLFEPPGQAPPLWYCRYYGQRFAWLWAALITLVLTNFRLSPFYAMEVNGQLCRRSKQHRRTRQTGKQWTTASGRSDLISLVCRPVSLVVSSLIHMDGF